MTMGPIVSTKSIAAFDRFVDRCMLDPSRYSLVPGGASSPFALCFGIFALHLTRRHELIARHRRELIDALLENINSARMACTDVHGDKSYRQLLTLSLSALSILNGIHVQQLNELVLEQISRDTTSMLTAFGALDGSPQSGNQAMFQAIFLLHAERYLGYSAGAELEQWIGLHLSKMNRFGFWGSGVGPTHLFFQNGYHQYEIFEYLSVENTRESEAARSVMSLADQDGHYAPYPGGGACFDYDGVFLLTPNGKVAPYAGIAELLSKTFITLSREQREDGGFCENLLLRPRYLAIPGYFERLITAKNHAVLKERVRYAISLQRPKYDKLITHWTNDSRQWADSDLFSSWFRLLTLARIECAFFSERASFWGFINYPGIGYHPSLRSQNPAK